jgi:hypothetical protein
MDCYAIQSDINQHEITPAQLYISGVYSDKDAIQIDLILELLESSVAGCSVRDQARSQHIIGENWYEIKERKRIMPPGIMSILADRAMERAEHRNTDGENRSGDKSG